MSVFEDNGDNQNAIDNLVGEDKKFKTVEDLAKGKLESDRYIEELKAKLDEAQANLSKTDKIDKLLETLESRQATQSEGDEVKTDLGQNDTTRQDDVDIEAKIKQAIEEDRLAREANNNVSKVEQELVSKFGDKANEVVRDKARELNMGLEEMQALAQKSPQAFFRLLGTSVETASQRKPSLSSEGVMPNTGEVRDWAYWSKQRKENPEFYKSMAAVKQRQQDRIDLGDKFFK